MDKFTMATELMACFPNSFINYQGEFIAHRKANVYFNLGTCETVLDVKCKVIEWLSRAACKGGPYRSDHTNEDFRKFMRKGINKFLGTSFTQDDMELIYTHLGNACHHSLTEAFVQNGYSLDLLRYYENLEGSHGET